MGSRRAAERLDFLQTISISKLTKGKRWLGRLRTILKIELQCVTINNGCAKVFEMLKLIGASGV